MAASARPAAPQTAGPTQGIGALGPSRLSPGSGRGMTPWAPRSGLRPAPPPGRNSPAKPPAPARIAGRRDKSARDRAPVSTPRSPPPAASPAACSARRTACRAPPGAAAKANPPAVRTRPPPAIAHTAAPAPRRGRRAPPEREIAHHRLAACPGIRGREFPGNAERVHLQLRGRPALHRFLQPLLCVFPVSREMNENLVQRKIEMAEAARRALLHSRGELPQQRHRLRRAASSCRARSRSSRLNPSVHSMSRKLMSPARSTPRARRRFGCSSPRNFSTSCSIWVSASRSSAHSAAAR